MELQDIRSFARWLWPDSISEAQLALLASFNGLPLSYAERSLWRRFTGQKLFARYVPKEYAEGICLLGRQSGKSSRVAITQVLFEALKDRAIPPGERRSILLLTPTLRQNLFALLCEKVRSVPELQELVVTDAESTGVLSLSNGIDVEAISANPRYARGKTCVLIVVDEVAWLRTDQDFVVNLPELLESLRPALIVCGGKLLLLSSVGGREGYLFEGWETREANLDCFIWKADSRSMNPSISEKLLEKERRRGSSYFAREFLSEFTDSASPFFDPASLDAAIIRGVTELPPEPSGFVCGGLDLADRRDDCAFVVSAVVQKDGVAKVATLYRKVWKAGLRGHPVLSILEEVAGICKHYNVRKVWGDQKSMAVAEQVLGRAGVEFTRVVTAGAGSEGMYRTVSVLLNEGRVLLLDDDTLLTQLRRIEEKTTDAGRFLAEGRRGTKDDLATAWVASTALAAENLRVPRAPVTEAIFVAPGSANTGNWREDRFFIGPRRTALSRPRF